ncbi:MAG: glycosyltransferase family 39 protein [Opitutaceae bacterium]
MSRPPRFTPRPPAPRWPLYAAVALTLLHFLWLGWHRAPAIMSPDANGYVVQARLIADEGRTGFAPASPAQYIGMHWLRTESGVYHSRYPAGLPLLFAAAWKAGGLSAALWINPFLASATVLLTFFLARRITTPAHALLAAAVVALVPVFNQHALDADAHIAAAFFLTAGTLLLLRFAETRGTGAGLAAGLLLGIVPTIRYPEVLAGIAVAGWLLWRFRPWWRAWPAVAGALVPIVALCIHNAAAYGAFWKTGYALTGEQTGFGWSYFLGHAVPYLQALGGHGLGLAFAFGAAGLAALCVDDRRRVTGALLAGVTAPLVLLYMAYYFGGGGPGGAAGNLRFLIPVFPLLAVAAAWLLGRIAHHQRAAGLAAVVAFAAIQIIIGLAGSAQVLAAGRASLSAAARVREVAEKHAPAGSVLVVERQLAESLDATGRWKLAEESLVGGFGPGPGGPGGGVAAGPRGPAAGRSPNRPGGGAFPGSRGPGGPDGPFAEDGPNPMQRDKNPAQRDRYAGLDPTARRARVWADLRAWAGDKPVFWLVRSLEVADEMLPPGFDYRILAEVENPVMMGPGGGGGGPMGPRSGPMMGPGGPPGGPGMRRGNTGPIADGTKLRLIRLSWPQ